MRHWPEWLLVILFIVAGSLELILVPASPTVRLLLVPVAWVFAFAVWAGVIWFVCKAGRTPDQH